MKKLLYLFTFILLVMFFGCKKDDNNPVGSDVPTYPVTAVVLNPAGQPQGGATLTLKNPPSDNAKFTATTDSTGKATIQAPEGQQTLIAKMGSVFMSELNVNVTPSAQGISAGTIKLQQNAAKKVLVVLASAENLEDVLRDPKINYTQFDEIHVDSLRSWADNDSTALLNYLKSYTLIFSDCDGGNEDYFPKLARVYGRFISNGGNMYGGHYNYYNLQDIWPGNYDENAYNNNSGEDKILIKDNNLKSYLGFDVAVWNSTDSRGLSGYENFSDLPTNAKVYGVINGSNPPIAVIVENYVGLGRYLWTDYHNQDIKDDAKLIKIVQYFLYSL